MYTHNSSNIEDEKAFDASIELLLSFSSHKFCMCAAAFLSPSFFLKVDAFWKAKVPTVHLLTRTQRVSMGSGRTSRQAKQGRALGEAGNLQGSDSSTTTANERVEE